MRRTTYTNGISKILKEIANRRGDRMIENPAVQFTLDAKAGEYDEVSDETYNFLLNCQNSGAIRKKYLQFRSLELFSER